MHRSTTPASLAIMLASITQTPSALLVIEKLPAWIHALTMLVFSIVSLLTLLAHLPLPKKSKAAAVIRYLGPWFAGLLKELRKIDAEQRAMSLEAKLAEAKPKPETEAKPEAETKPEESKVDSPTEKPEDAAKP